jgi:osmoprotectant transport system ATP-binding protein
MIRLEDVTKFFGSFRAVDRVSLTVEQGELMVLVGESGSGKTTTLKMINRLIDPSEGRIFVSGRETGTQDPVLLRRSIGYVFQKIGLFPHMTVAHNVAIVPTLLGWKDKDAVNRRVDDLLELVGLEPAQYRHRYPSELSGGQRQRVGVARALVARPAVVLMDEPFGALDAITRSRLQKEYLRLHKSLGLTTLMVTHDIMEAFLLGDRVAVMKGGRLLQCDAPAKLLRHPADGYVESLLETPRTQLIRLEAITSENDES